MFNPVADTYVSSAQPTTSFGTKPSFFVDASPVRQSFLMFSLSNLSGREVTDVRLRMKDVDNAPVGGVVYSMTSNAWDEAITWGTKPDIDGPALASLGPVSAGNWYEADLGTLGVFDGDLSLAMDSANGDAAAYSSRQSLDPPQLIVEVEAVPGLVLDGLSQVANPWVGSSDPTYYSSQHRVVVTDLGRLLVVHGRHTTGVQLAWRDPGGGWQTVTTGATTNGLLVSNPQGTGDWAASIALADDSSGVQHAWVVYTGPFISKGRAVTMRRLSDLDAPAGPTVGPEVTVEPLGLGNMRADLAFESVPGGSQRGAVVFYSKTGPTTYAMKVSWFTDLDSDTPSVVGQSTLFTSSNASLSGTLVPSDPGLALVARSTKLYVYSHDSDAPLDSWSRSAAGVAASASARPSATTLDTGEVLAAVSTSSSTSVVRFSADGTSLTLDLSLPGYVQAAIAGDGTSAWLVAIRSADGFVVSRSFAPGSGWTSVDAVEVGPEGGGNYEWPNVANPVDGRLRFIVRGPFFPGKTRQTEVLAFQRPV